MEQKVNKKRLSILKKRRSRSVSPSSPTEKFDRRLSRRISFSGKHAVREFFTTEENKETIWGASYEESTEQNAISCEPLTLNSQWSHSTLIKQNHTRNETIHHDISMDCSNIVIEPIKISTSIATAQSSIQRSRTIFSNEISIEEKENVNYRQSVLKKDAGDVAASDCSNYFTEPIILLNPFAAARSSLQRNRTIFSNEEKENADVIASSSMDTNDTKIQTELKAGKKQPIKLFEKLFQPNVSSKTNMLPVNKSVSNLTTGIQNQPMPIDTSDIALDQSTGAVFIEYPVPVPPKCNITDAKINISEFKRSPSISNCKYNGTVYDQFSIDQSFDIKKFSHLNITMDKENIIPSHLPVEQLNLAPQTFNAHDDKENNSLLCDTFNSSAVKSQWRRQTVNEPHQMEETNTNLNLPVKSLNFPPQTFNAHDDKENNALLCDTFNSSAVPSQRRRQTVNESHQKEESNMNLSIQPYEPINVTLDMSIVNEVQQKQQQQPQLQHHIKRQTVYCNESICDKSELTSMNNTDNKSMCDNSSMCVSTEPNQTKTASSIPFTNVIQFYPMNNNATIHGGPINITGMDLSLAQGQKPAELHQSKMYRDEKIISEANDVILSAADSYNHLTINNTLYDISLHKISASTTNQQISILEDSNHAAQSFACHQRPSVLPQMSHNNDQNNHINEFALLTFIDEDDVNENISCTKIDLVESSIELPCDGGIPLEQPHAWQGTGHLPNASSTLFSMKQIHQNSYNEPKDVNGIIETNDRLSVFQEQPRVSIEARRQSMFDVPISPIVLAEERKAFKKSNILRRSNAFSEIVAIEKENLRSISTTMTLAQPIEKSKKLSNSFHIQRRLTGKMDGDENNSSDVSYLQNVTADKQINELKLDFSGYEKFKGLATPFDVLNAFYRRCDLQIERFSQLKEDAKSSPIGEINDSNELMSHNIEAPSFKFLYLNKNAMIHDNLAKNLRAKHEDRLVGAIVPIIPSIFTLVSNKCRELNHWTFCETWFYAGRLILRHKSIKSFQIVFYFDPDEKLIEQNIKLYGKMVFSKADTLICKTTTKIMLPRDRLRLQELLSKLPIDLLSMCPSSMDLSDFDEKMHAYARNAYNKVTDVLQAVIKGGARICKSDSDDLLYIHHRLSDYAQLYSQEYIIELTDIDSTGPNNVRTNPFRSHHSDINAVPRGVNFIQAFVSNALKFMPIINGV